jgi:hypothetical protein
MFELYGFPPCFKGNNILTNLPFQTPSIAGDSCESIIDVSAAISKLPMALKYVNFLCCIPPPPQYKQLNEKITKL